MADANTLFLATFDGVDGATHAHNVFDTDVPCPVLNWASVLSSTSVKYGTTALYCDGVLFRTNVSIWRDKNPPISLLNFGTNDYCIDSWVCPYNSAYNGVWLSCYGNFWGDATDSCLSWKSVANKFAYHYVPVGSGTDFKLLVSTTSITWGQWYHIAISRESGVFRMFVNGIKEAESADYLAGNVSFSKGIRLGWAGWDTYGYIPHRTQYFRISNIARYTADFTPPVVADYDIPSSGALPDIRTVPLMPRRVP